MTDSYTAAWLAEMWPTCREYGAPPSQRKPPEKSCPHCGLYSSTPVDKSPGPGPT